jgi:hypothetical protein
MNRAPGSFVPDSCSVGFKEWQGVCDALAAGRQSVLLRKGGIEEGPGGFAPEHPAFWLYPTRVHQAEQGLKPGAAGGGVAAGSWDAGSVRLGTFAVVAVTARVGRPESLDALDGLHVWTPETVRRRFDYRSPGLWVLGVRVFVRAEPAVLPVTPEHAGCKTWVLLDPPASTDGLTPVLDDHAFTRELSRLAAALGSDHDPVV